MITEAQKIAAFDIAEAYGLSQARALHAVRVAEALESTGFPPIHSADFDVRKAALGELGSVRRARNLYQQLDAATDIPAYVDRAVADAHEEYLYAVRELEKSGFETAFPVNPPRAFKEPSISLPYVA